MHVIARCSHNDGKKCDLAIEKIKKNLIRF